MTGRIYIGIGGWVYEPWRGTFYPAGLSQKKELAYAASKLTSIEINGTYYGTQSPATFAKWREETPDGFVFSLKGSRFATNRKDLSQSKESVERFCAQGISELKEKLGPINWQFMATKKYDRNDFENFLKLLPPDVDGVELKHAVEVRHDSFCTQDFVDLARRYKVAVITAADDPDFPQIADQTGPFAYVRLQGSDEDAPQGYSDKDLDDWTRRLKALAAGEVPGDLSHVTDGMSTPRDVYAYVISGHKVSNPQAAMALIARVTG